MATGNEHLSEQIAEVLATADPIGIAPDNPNSLDEYRTEADAIAAQILRAEVDRRSPSQAAVAKIVRSVLQHWFEHSIGRGEAKAIAERILARRLFDLMHTTIAAEAASVLTDGRATLLLQSDPDDSPAIELKPTRTNAATLVAFVEYDRLVTCSIGAGFSHEIFANNQRKIAEEVRGLVRAVIGGTYREKQKDGRAHSTVRAEWPGGGSSCFDTTVDAGGPQTEWRLRAYDPY